MERQLLRTLEEKVAPGHTALIMVDVQNDFCATGGFLDRTYGPRGFQMHDIQAMVPRLEGLLAAARKAGLLRIFIQSYYDDCYLSDPMVEMMERDGRDLPLCLKGSWGADFYHIRPQEGEIVVNKHRFNAFEGTDLDLVLRNHQIRTLVLTGVATNVCVESTLRAGFFKNYYIVCPGDCVASYNASLHQATLQNVSCYFGVVTESETLCRLWAPRVALPRGKATAKAGRRISHF